jgi:DNA sulfur modification protein DndD
MKMQEEYLQQMEDYRNNMQFSKMFNMFVGKIQDYPDSLLLSLSRIDNQLEDSEDKIEELVAKRKKLLDTKKTIDEEIQSVKTKYGINPVEQADTANIINTNIRASRSNLEREQRKLEDSKKMIANYNRELREAQSKLDALYSKDKSVEKVSETEWKNISIFLDDICKNVQENARKELLRKIEERSNQFYAKFTEHDNGYKRNVKIGEDYSIEFDPGLNTSHEDRKKMSIINALLALNQEAVGTYYPFISDAPTSSFDTETTHKYLLGIKDIFGQSIIMTKDVDIDSDNYNDLVSQPNVSKIYLLESELYCDEGVEPKLYEVSTKVSQKK